MRLFCIFSSPPSPWPKSLKSFVDRPQEPQKQQCDWEKMASAKAAASPAFNCYRLMGACVATGMRLEIYPPEASHILYLFCPDRF